MSTCRSFLALQGAAIPAAGFAPSGIAYPNKPIRLVIGGDAQNRHDDRSC